jgi:large subunit ribosomal protein L18
MKRHNRIVVKFRRYRTGHTDYHKRLSLLKSQKPRLVIRKSLNYINIQFVEYLPVGDKVITSINSKSLEKYGWKYKMNNVPASYLTGFLAGTLAKKKIKEAVVDLGRIPSTKGSKIYAAIKGVVDAGIKVNISEDILPSNERISGEHIKSYAEKVKKENPKLFEKIYSKHIKSKISVENITKVFEQTKNKISAKKSE